MPVIEVINKTVEVKEMIAKDAAELIAHLCFSTEAEAKKAAPVDTGALMASIYVHSPLAPSTYQKAKTKAEEAARKAEAKNVKKSKTKSKSKKRKFKMLDEAPKETSVSGLVAVGAEYGFWMEFGEHKKPYFCQAVDKAINNIDKFIKKE